MNHESGREDRGLAGVSARPEVLSVSQLNRSVANLLERSFPMVRVSGEISNFVRAASGHCYFTLKDASAQVRAVMFRSRAAAIGFRPREGDRVEALALVTLYQARGDFQLNVETLRQAGAGDLYQEFLRLKAKLQAEGLLDDDRKQALPRLPWRIGVVSSTRAAALRDVLSTLARRSPQVDVIVYPTPVQGVEAPAAIVAALEAANRRAEVDLVLLVRGGGSIEDLWAFNDERVARAIASSVLPVVSGVGHESDVTIADFVADLRASTPTAAATLAAPARSDLVDALRLRTQRLVRAHSRYLRETEQGLDTAARLLRPPSVELAIRASALRESAGALRSALWRAIESRRVRLESMRRALRVPELSRSAERLDGLSRRLRLAAAKHVSARQAQVESNAAKLELVSPVGVLDRGYALVRGEDGHLLRDVRATTPGKRISVRLARGELSARVESTDDPNDGPAQEKPARQPG
ncbi:MAG: exodeoxyribonuclease VII large subunit [Burkholderiaceae bacterium]|nr:exodeoxyribonuclease VII large subunit [Burkholderiaceae bacterium]